MGKRKDIAIIGAGKVGTALGILAAKTGRRVVAVADVRDAAATAGAKAVGTGARVCSPEQAAALADVLLLTVPDDAIALLCASLAQANAFRRGGIVAHCSGALDSETLAPARDRCRCRVVSMHPLQTFPDVSSAVAKLPGTYFFCEGDASAVAELSKLAEAIGGKVVRIAPTGKVLYHAAAVVACNYLTALLDAALELCGRAGIERAVAMEALGPLVRSTVDNVLAQGPAAALTGPIARGDAETIRRHLEALEGAPQELRDLYRVAGLWTCRLAGSKGTSPEAIRRTRNLLDETNR